MLFEPIRSKPFRQLLTFTVFWSFAANMAGAFFGVYMLQRLGMPMGIVISLSVLSQVVNVLFYRIWGTLADSWSNRSVLLASNALFNGASATLAPIVGGLIADALAGSEFTANFSFTETISEGQPVVFSALNLRGLDFVFILAAIVGFYGLHRLAYVEEPESRTDKISLDTVMAETRKSIASISNVAGLRKLAYFPFYILVEKNPLRSSGNSSRKGEPPPEKSVPPES